MLSRGTRPATPSVYVVTWRWSAAKVVGFATAVAAAGSCSAGGATGASPADGVLALLRMRRQVQAPDDDEDVDAG